MSGVKFEPLGNFTFILDWESLHFMGDNEGTPQILSRQAPLGRS